MGIDIHDEQYGPQNAALWHTTDYGTEIRKHAPFLTCYSVPDRNVLFQLSKRPSLPFKVRLVKSMLCTIEMCLCKCVTSLHKHMLPGR